MSSDHSERALKIKKVFASGHVSVFLAKVFSVLTILQLNGVSFAEGRVRGGTPGLPKEIKSIMEKERPQQSFRSLMREKSIRAVSTPALAGKLDRRLTDAWETVSKSGAEAALIKLKKLKVTIAENGQDAVVVALLEDGADLKEVERKINACGAVIIRSGAGSIKATVPIDRLDRVALVQGVRNVRPLLPPRKRNTTTTEGVSVTLANTWHSAALTGQGVKVAVVDTEFSNLATLKAQDEIPAAATETNFTETAMTSGTGVHGSACAEIVYDMAPGVQMYLIKVDDPTDLVLAKDYCIANGISLVTCSLGWDCLNFHDGMAYANWFTTGDNHPVKAVEDAAAAGILWVNAAGNEQRQQTTIDWRDADAYDDVDWDSDQAWLNPLWINGSYTVPADTYINVVMTWNQWPTTSQDFDVALWMYNGSSLTLQTAGATIQNGGSDSYPYEECWFVTTNTARFFVSVQKYSASSAPKFILRYYCQNSTGQNIEPYYYGYDNYTSPVPGSVCIPADSASAFTVGALDYATYTNGNIEWFSSLGPNNRAYTGGFAVTKPDLCGPDRTKGVSYGSDGFGGTSAATPHVAGLAALVKGVYPSYAPTQIRAYLESNSFDLGTAGKDNTYGAGATRLPVPPATVVVVTFDPQSGSVTPTSTVVTNGLTYGTLPTPTRTGYTFGGWWTAAGGAGTQVTSGTTVTVTTSQTLYAKWTPVTYPVTYDANGATGGTVPANQTKTHDVALTLAYNSGSLVRAGYTFAGWNTSANGSGTDYAAGSSYTANAALALYAKWVPLTTSHGTPYFWLDENGLAAGGDYEAADLADPDGDGVANWLEYQTGTGPLAPTDRPAYNVVPYAEPFENLAGWGGVYTNVFPHMGWHTSLPAYDGSRIVNLPYTFEGCSRPLPSATHTNVLRLDTGAAVLTNSFGNGFDLRSAITRVDMMMRIQPGSRNIDEFLDSKISVYADEETGRLMIYHGVALPDGTLLSNTVSATDILIDVNTWYRLTFTVDATATNVAMCQLRFNGTVVANPSAYPEGWKPQFLSTGQLPPAGVNGTWFRLATTNQLSQFLTGVTFSGVGYMDDLVVKEEPATVVLSVVRTGNGSSSLGSGTFAAVEIPAGTETQIVYTAADWHRVSALVANNAAVPGASGTRVFTQAFVNVNEDISNDVFFAAASPAQTGYSLVSTAWLMNWSENAVLAGDGDSFDVPTEYLLGLSPVSPNTYGFIIESVGMSGSQIVTVVKRTVTGGLSPDGMHGNLILQAADSLTSAFTNIANTAVTGTTAFDADGRRAYTSQVNRVSQFFRARIE